MVALSPIFTPSGDAKLAFVDGGIEVFVEPVDDVVLAFTKKGAPVLFCIEMPTEAAVISAARSLLASYREKFDG